MRIFAILSVLALLGCGGSKDPCSGKSGLCIGLRIEGSITNLDQLAVSINEPDTAVQYTPSVPKSFTLPQQVALFPPAGTTGTVHIGAVGLSDGNAIAHGEVDATIGSHSTVTLTLGASSGDLPSPDLLGLDLVGADLTGGADLSLPPDLASCVSVTTCQDGDGCCPTGCNNSTDHDCASICGNHVVETGEVCDDANDVNGDGCDATCQWTGTMTTVSGVPGAFGYADSMDGSAETARATTARFAGRFGWSTFFSIIGDSNEFWISDNTGTIRQMDYQMFDLGFMNVRTIFGVPYDKQVVNGAVADARIGGAESLVHIGSDLYFVDGGLRVAHMELPHSIEAVDTSAAQNSPMVLTTEGTTLYYLGSAGELNQWAPGGAASSVIASAAAISALGTSCSGVTRGASATFVGCANRILQVLDNGTVSAFAGDGSAATTCTNNANPAMATFGGVVNDLLADTDGTLIVTSCQAVRRVGTSGVTTIAGQLNTPGYGVGSGSSVAFAFGRMPLAWAQSNQLLVGDSGNGIIDQVNATNGDTFTVAGAAPAAHATEVLGNGSDARYLSTSGLITDGSKIYAQGFAGLISVDMSSGNSKLLYTFDVGFIYNYPQSLAGNPMARIGSTLYIAMSDGTIHSIGTDGTNHAVLAGVGGGTVYPPTDGTPGNLRTAVMSPLGLASDGTDLYYIDNSHLVKKITLATSTLSLVAGTQDSTDIVDGRGANAHFRNPRGLAYANGSLYTLDGLNACCDAVVRQITLATGAVMLIAGDVNSGPMPPATAYGDADGVGTAGQLAGANFLATDGLSLFISDATVLSKDATHDPTIRQLELKTLKLTTFVGQRGQWTIANGVGTKAAIHMPGPITFDATTHQLFFFDMLEGVFQKIH